MIGRLASLGIILMLSACGGSPPSHFYTLAPRPPAGPVSAQPGLIVTVGHVTLPPALDRASVVTQLGPERLDVSERDRWAAPLDGIIQRVLSADLAQRMPRSTVVAPGDPAPAGHVVTVDVNVHQFIGDANGRVTLDADWRIGGSHTSQSASLSRQADSSKIDAITAAMSELLAELSDRIATALH